MNETEKLAKRMWDAYIQANGGYRDGYSRWNALTDKETKKGFLAVAEMMIETNAAALRSAQTKDDHMLGDALKTFNQLRKDARKAAKRAADRKSIRSVMITFSVDDECEQAMFEFYQLKESRCSSDIRED